MPYTRKARRNRGEGKGNAERRMPEGVVLVGGRGGSKDAVYVPTSLVLPAHAGTPRTHFYTPARNHARM